MNNLRVTSALSLLSLMLVVPASIAACTGDDDAEPTTPDTTQDASTTPPPPPPPPAVDDDDDVPPTDDAGVDAEVEESTEVQLTFAAKIGAQPFACGSDFEGVGSPPRTLTPVDFRFYVHDVRLVDAEGNEVPLALEQNDWQHQDVALLDFEDGTGACANGDSELNNVIVGHTETKITAVGVKFRLGVPSALNHGDLSAQPSPLDRTSLFWTWNSGYIFMRAESSSTVPVDDDPEQMAPKTHSSHVGSGGCTGNAVVGEEVTCVRPNRPELTIDDFDPSTQAIVVDFAAIKAGSDLAGASCHGHGAACAAPFAALGIDSTSGDYLGTQTVFSKE